MAKKDLMMESTVAGIPCLVDVIRISGNYVPAKTNADPDSCYEAEYPEVDFEVCDRNGRPAPWLSCKMTDADAQRIEEQILEGA